MSVPTDQPGPARRRLVIPLTSGQRGSYQPGPAGQRAGQAAARPAAPRKSRVGKVLAILGVGLIVVLLCVAAGVFFWWRHYQTTPAYSLAVLVDAAQRNDMATVDKIVDTDKIVDNFVAQVSEKAAGRYGPALSSAARKQIDALVPSLMPAIKQSVRDGIAARVKEVSENKAGQKPFIVVAVALPYFANITVDGDTAKAAADIHEQHVECDLKRDGDVGWRVVAVRDDALVQRVVDQVLKDLPAIGQSGGQDILKHLPRNLPRIHIP